MGYRAVFSSRERASSCVGTSCAQVSRGKEVEESEAQISARRCVSVVAPPQTVLVLFDRPQGVRLMRRACSGFWSEEKGLSSSGRELAELLSDASSVQKAYPGRLRLEGVGGALETQKKRKKDICCLTYVEAVLFTCS